MEKHPEFHHAKSDHQRIDQILRMNLHIWMVTQALYHAVSGKKSRKVQPHCEAKRMAAIDDALTQLNQSVKDLQTASDAAIAAGIGGAVTTAQVQAVGDAATAIGGVASALKAATPTPPVA